MKKVLFSLALPLAIGAQDVLDPPPSVTALLLEASRLQEAGALTEARAILAEYLDANPRAVGVRRRLYALNKKHYLSPADPSRSPAYMVKRGDTLTKIARTYAITAGLLRRLNGLKNDNLSIGQRLKIVRGPFDIRIEKRSFRLDVLSRGKVIFTYPVGLGKDNSTPAGTYVVGPRLVKPTQFDRETGRKIKFGAPGHTIGTRWITFSGQYGIHGTVEPDSIGKEESHGCVRLRNKDVEELFDLIVTGKSKVTIAESFPAPVESPPAGDQRP
jgi:LysM repeat protein